MKRNDTEEKNNQKKDVSTEVRNQTWNVLWKFMGELKLDSYASNDAVTFSNLIPKNMKNSVLEKSKKVSKITHGHGIAMSRTGVEMTAKNIQQVKAGECHTFSALACDYLLSKLENKQSTVPLHIKIVSYKDKEGLGSHTFLLINHEKEKVSDLTGQPNMWIVDPWLYVMGYNQSNGIFTTKNYPCKYMLQEIECVKNFDLDPVHQELLGNVELAKKLKQTQEIKPFTSKLSSTMFDHKATIPEIKFVDRLIEAFNQPNYKNEFALLSSIKEDILNNRIPSTQVIPMLINIYFVAISGNIAVDKMGNYTWKKEDGMVNNENELFTNYLLTELNNPSIKKIIVSYINNLPEYKTKNTKINIDEFSAKNLKTLCDKIIKDKNIKNNYFSPRKTISLQNK